MKNGSHSQKPPNQGHTNATKPKAKKSMAKNTMGMGKVTPKAKGTMGKHQSTGDGKAF
jgi:hypothetical protein